MTRVESQSVERHLGGYLIAVVSASENYESERRHITHSVKLPWPAPSLQTSGPGNKLGKKRVCTMCTPWPLN